MGRGGAGASGIAVHTVFSILQRTNRQDQSSHRRYAGGYHVSDP